MAEEQHRSYIYKAALCGGLGQFPLTHSPGSIYNILVQHKQLCILWYDNTNSYLKSKLAQFCTLQNLFDIIHSQTSLAGSII